MSITFTLRQLFSMPKANSALYDNQLSDSPLLNLLSLLSDKDFIRHCFDGPLMLFSFTDGAHCSTAKPVRFCFRLGQTEPKSIESTKLQNSDKRINSDKCYLQKLNRRGKFLRLAFSKCCTSKGFSWRQAK